GTICAFTLGGPFCARVSGPIVIAGRGTFGHAPIATERRAARATTNRVRARRTRGARRWGSSELAGGRLILATNHLPNVGPARSHEQHSPEQQEPHSISTAQPHALMPLQVMQHVPVTTLPAQFDSASTRSESSTSGENLTI